MREPKRYLQCCRCHAWRRKVVELIDPKDEIPYLYCVPCAEKWSLRISFRRRQALPFWRHADDPAMSFLAVLR